MHVLHRRAHRLRALLVEGLLGALALGRVGRDAEDPLLAKPAALAQVGGDLLEHARDLEAVEPDQLARLERQPEGGLCTPTRVA